MFMGSSLDQGYFLHIVAKLGDPFRYTNVVPKSFNSLSASELCIVLACPFSKVKVAGYHTSAHISNVSCDLTLCKVHFDENTLARDEIRVCLKLSRKAWLCECRMWIEFDGSWSNQRTPTCT